MHYEENSFVQITSYWQKKKKKTWQKLPAFKTEKKKKIIAS